jgi:hypothetical protein
MSATRLGLALVATSMLAAPAPALAWTKSYVVEWMERAFYYGGPENGNAETKGPDCPTGINPEMDWQKLLTKDYRSAEEVSKIRHPEYRAPGQQAFYRHLGFRGPNKENVYENPTAGGDPGFVEVTGKVGEGFDLDNNPATGFTSPTGEKGVDNGFYKASGCVWRWRGMTRLGGDALIHNEAMRDGRWTTVVVLSGEGADPMNDSDVTIGLYSSKDIMTKDAAGKIAADYTFRVDPNPDYQTVFKAKITDGVVETQGPTFIRMHDVTPSNVYAKLKLYQGRIKWRMHPDGSMTGLVGGYREWFSHYVDQAAGFRAYGDAASAAVRENLGHIDLAAWYHALRRNADGLPDPKTGENRGISTAYRVMMVPAFVVTPDAKTQLTAAEVIPTQTVR